MREALVTGGADGIGLAIARALAGSGHRVTIADLDADQAAKVADLQPFNRKIVVLANEHHMAELALQPIDDVVWMLFDLLVVVGKCRIEGRARGAFDLFHSLARRRQSAQLVDDVARFGVNGETDERERCNQPTAHGASSR